MAAGSGAATLPAYDHALPENGESLAAVAAPAAGHRIAAVGLVANSVVFLLIHALWPEGIPREGSQVFVGAAVIDLLVAIGILQSTRWAVPLALVRLTLGALLGVVTSLVAGDWIQLALVLTLCGGFFLLLVGNASTGRIAGGVVLVALSLLVSLGAVVLHRVAPGVLVTLSGAVEDVVHPEVRDPNGKWEMAWPGPDWRPRKAEHMAKEAPNATSWLVHPSHDAHLMILPEHVASDVGRLDPDAMTRAVLDNLRTKSQNLQVLDTRPGLGGGRLVHLRAEMNGLQLEYYVGIVQHRTAVYALLGFAHVKDFPSVKDELETTIRSFRELR